MGVAPDSLLYRKVTTRQITTTKSITLYPLKPNHLNYSNKISDVCIYIISRQQVVIYM